MTNLRLDIATREDTSGDNFRIEIDSQPIANRGVAGELLIRRAEKLKNRSDDDVRVGRFAGFGLFVRVGFVGDPDLVLRGKNSYAAKVTATALGTIRSLEATVQGFEERALKLEAAIGDAQKRGTELEGRVGAPFDREERYQELTRRQGEIEEKLDLTKNQAPSQVEAAPSEETTQAATEKETNKATARPNRRASIRV